MKRFISAWNRTSLIKRIAIGVVIGAILGLTDSKDYGYWSFGRHVCWWIKGDCPTLGFLLLVANALSQTREGQQSNMKTIIVALSLWDLCGCFDGCYFSLYFSNFLKIRSSLSY